MDFIFCLQSVDQINVDHLPNKTSHPSLFSSFTGSADVMLFYTADALCQICFNITAAALRSLATVPPILDTRHTSAKSGTPQTST